MNEISPSTLILQEGRGIPNNPRLPVLIYRKVLDKEIANKSKKFQHCFEQNNWKGVWKNGLYDYHHFHSSSHEVLGIASGKVEMQLGGEGGKSITLDAGDLIVLPAGTGHRCAQASEHLVIIGAYPEGQENYDICRHKNDMEKDALVAISSVSLPQSDPLYGINGPLVRYWIK